MSTSKQQPHQAADAGIKPDAPDLDGINDKFLHVVARTDGFRRAGRAWPAAGVTVQASDFSEQQLDALESEPMLILTVIGDNA